MFVVVFVIVVHSFLLFYIYVCIYVSARDCMYMYICVRECMYMSRQNKKKKKNNNNNNNNNKYT